MEVVLASVDQKRERDRLTHSAWGERLSVEEYLDREQRLRAHPFASEGMRTWFLVERDEVLASCETFRMKSVWNLEPGHSHGFASVFTEPKHRGRGFASRLISEVNARLVDEGAQAALLFSDVGPELYARVGFVARPAFERVYAPASGAPSEAAELVREEQLVKVLERVHWPDDRFLIQPTAAQLDWHLERERAYAQLLRHPRPECCGAVAGEGVVFFAGNLKRDELVVLLLTAHSTDEASALLEAARRVAHRAGLERVVAWEQGGSFWPEQALLVRRAREDHLPMLRPFIQGLTADAWSFIPRALWV